MTFCVGVAPAQEAVDFLPEKSATVPYVSRADSLALPPLTVRGTISHFPYYGSFLTGFSDWSLHSGLNASLSASAIFGLGRHSGSGFANSLSLMYANTITPKLSFALGGYSSFLDYGHRQMRDAGLTAMLSYSFNEHWEADAFVQKSIVQPRIPPQLYWIGDVGDKIGASLRYNFNPQFSVSVSIWESRQPSIFTPYYYE